MLPDREYAETGAAILESAAEVWGKADLAIGCVLILGASVPKLLRREMLAAMKPGTVMVDVSIDTGRTVVVSRAAAAGLKLDGGTADP